MRWVQRLQSLGIADAFDLLVSAHPGVSNGLPEQAVIIGATHIAEDVARTCSNCGIVIHGIFDDSPEYQGENVAGYSVQPTRDLTYIGKHIPVILATHRALGLTHRMREEGFIHVWPFPILSLRWPNIFTSHIFYAGMHENLISNATKLLQFDEALADTLSRQTLDAVIAFRLTFDVSYLEPVLQPNAYFPTDIFSLGTAESYVDGGAFTGDTIRRFLERAQNMYENIVAFEPSPGTYKELAAAFANHSKIRCIQACLYSRDTELCFGGTDSRDATINENGHIKCPAMRIDSLPESQDISLIKLNIEGSEADALYGAQATLAKNTPKLAVAAYHRPQDLWQLFEIIKEIQHDYRFYMRQHDGGIIETVLYGTTHRTGKK
ncbi:methyltransferase, FkbM family [Desulfonatronum zhilinae]|nr:methyltransferase, FkbM family [Desulfonatronum zhilinae]